jgi:hypothetical protein
MNITGPLVSENRVFGKNPVFSTGNSTLLPCGSYFRRICAARVSREDCSGSICLSYNPDGRMDGWTDGR